MTGSRGLLLAALALATVRGLRPVTVGRACSAPTSRATSTPVPSSSSNDVAPPRVPAALAAAVALATVLSLQPAALAADAFPPVQSETIVRQRPSPVADLLSDVTGRAKPAAKLAQSGIPVKLRSISRLLDELQQDLYLEEWDVLQIYPPLLRAYVPLFEKYAVDAFPEKTPVSNSLRDAMRFEERKFFTSVSAFEKAADVKNVRKTENAYANMALSYVEKALLLLLLLLPTY